MCLDICSGGYMIYLGFWLTFTLFLNIIVSCTDGKILVRIKIGITFTYRLHHRPIQLVVLFPVGLSSILHLRHILLGAWRSTA